MSLDIDDKEKMIKTCQTILESCEKPFVWAEDLDQDPDQEFNSKKPFNLFLPHQQIDNELSELFETFSKSSYLYDQINATCTLDEEWVELGTYGMDRNIGLCFSKFTLKPEYVEQVKTYFNKRLIELQNSSSEMK